MNITQSQFDSFDFNDSETAKMVIRRALWDRIKELAIPTSPELVDLLQETEDTIFFAWQCGFSKGEIEGGRRFDPWDED